MDINIADFVSPAFDEVFYDIMNHGHTYYWMKGGRGSTKSSFVSLMIPILMLRHPECHVVVVRKVKDTIKSSVYPQIQWAIEELGISSLFRFKISPAEITLKHTGQQIVFRGADDPQKIKSFRPSFGYVGIVWFEELDQFNGMEEIRNLNQSLLRGGPVYWEFCSFNPPKSRDAWVNAEQLYDDPDRLINHSTYKDVPADWLGPQFLLEAEKLKERNETSYRHEYLGEATGTGGAVFDNVSDMAMDDEMIGRFDRRHYGLDFGFALDPLAFVQMHYDAKHEDLYIFGEIYRTHLMNKQAAALMAPLLPGHPVVEADSAEPKSIAELNAYLPSLGCHARVYGAKKGPDSVEFGIRWLQSLNHIYIDKRRAPNTYKEFMQYEYETNRAGEYISAYPDKNNHAIDACRYGCIDLMPRAHLSILKRK